MATQVQLRRGTSTQNDSFTGAQGELTFDTTNKRVRIHDGATTGGFELKTENAGGDTLFGDNDKAIFGAGSDLQIYHDGSDSWMNQTGTGHLNISNSNDDKDIYFRSDDGSGGLTAYFYLDGSGVETRFPKNLRFDDNVKAVFGAGSDLQIYHNGLDSYINDEGTGRLYIRGNDSVRIQATGGSENMGVFNQNGAVDLYYDNAKKLATTSTGIDVTGTVTADGLTTNGAAEGNTYFTGGTASSRLLNVFTSTHDGAANAGHNFKIASGQGAFIFGNNTTANLLTVKSTGIDVTGTVTADGLTVDGNATISSGSPTLNLTDTGGVGTATINANLSNIYYTTPSSGRGHYFKTNAGQNDALSITGGGDISFYEDTGTTAKFFWDASEENLGIGTSSPSAKLDIQQATAGNIISAEFDNTDYTANNRNAIKIRQQVSSGSSFSTFLGNDRNTGNVFLSNDSITANHLVIDTSGRVMIGTTTEGLSDGDDLTVSGSGSVGITIRSTSSGQNNLYFSDATSGAGEYAGYVTYEHNVNAMRLGTNGTERMRIDSSGNLLVGKTTSSGYTNGIELRPYGLLAASRDSSAPVLLNRTTNDGDIITLAKDGTTVGSIGTNLFSEGAEFGIKSNTGQLTLGTTNATKHLQFDSDQLYPSIDGGSKLGYSAKRFSDLYLSGGVYLGGTGSANKLDDYEEGTWTPVAAGSSSSGTASYSIQGGNYTKIGNMVYIMGRLGWSGHTGSGNLIVNGLPFSSGVDYAFLGFSFRDALTITAGKTAYVYVKPSSATAAFIEIGTGTSATSGVAMDTAVSDVSFSGFYRVP